MAKRRNQTGWTEEEYHEAMTLIHQDQDDRGWFDEPWWLDMEPSRSDIEEMVNDYLYLPYSSRS